MMNWRNANPELNDYGIALLEYEANSRKLKGYFLGRERMHTKGMIFGEFTAKRAPSPADA